MADEIRTKLFECGLVIYYSCSKTPCSRALVEKLIVAQLLKKKTLVLLNSKFDADHAIGLSLCQMKSVYIRKPDSIGKARTFVSSFHLRSLR